MSWKNFDRFDELCDNVAHLNSLYPDGSKWIAEFDGPTISHKDLSNLDDVAEELFGEWPKSELDDLVIDYDTNALRPNYCPHFWVISDPKTLDCFFDSAKNVINNNPDEI